MDNGFLITSIFCLSIVVNADGSATRVNMGMDWKGSLPSMAVGRELFLWFVDTIKQKLL